MNTIKSKVDFVHGLSMQYQHSGLKHRAGSPLFKYLFRGSDSDYLNNYNLVISQQSSFYSPRHKHNFEQFRFAVSGSFSIGLDSVPEIVLHEGELGYFPEGVEYGPQKDDNEVKEILVLQVAGPCRQGYFSWDELKRVQGIMDGVDGKFEGGKFYVKDSEEVKDGFEALWEKKMGRKLVYPQGRYTQPVIMKLEAFQWRNIGEGVWKKILGTFNEWGTTAEVLRVEGGGKVELEGKEGALRLFYVFKGMGQVDDEAIEEQSAFRLQPNQALVLSSNSKVEVLGILLPRIEE